MAELARVMDQYHNRFAVYDDVGSAGNHFHAWGKIGNDDGAVKISGASTDRPHSGATAIRAELHNTTGTNFGGFYFLNGVLPPNETAPQLNFGTFPDAGADLSGATSLSFWARGAHGGEVVEFFMGGVGRDPATGQPTTPHPDSSPAAKITVTLTDQWRPYQISLAGRDLHYVLGGFGWDASIANNPGGVVLYLDDIQYNLGPARLAQRLAEPRLLRSYETLPLQPNPLDANKADDFDFVLRNTAFTYDNALAILAFLADGTADSVRRASLVGDALVHHSNHDRTYTDGRLRSAYAAGDVAVAPGWIPHNKPDTAPVPGFYVEDADGAGNGTFFEVEDTSKKADVGDNAWAMIALLALYRRTGKAGYLETARRLGEFIQKFRNTSGMFPGFQGGLDDPEGTPTRRPWSSSEHNLDVHAAFTAMAQITGEPQWRQDAALAASFVESMYDQALGGYLTGTTDPDHRNPDPLPLDVQAWRVLALPDIAGRNGQALAFAEAHHRVTANGYTGFDFNQDRDGVWFEGTGQMATAYAFAHRAPDAELYRAELRRAQMPPPPPAGTGNGGLIAATAADRLSTGFDFSYYRRLHVGATAWNVFAQLGFNPFDQTDSPSSIIQLSRSALTVREGRPTVRVDLVRSGETSGSVSVRFATANGSARAGADYRSVSTVVTFGPGQTVRSILIPIIDDRRWEAVESFRAVLSNAQGEAFIGTRSAATVTIVDNDRPPHLTAVRRIVAAGRLAGLALIFDEPLNASRARDARNYIVRPFLPNGQLGTPIGVRVTFTPNTRAVVLRLVPSLAAGRKVSLTARGQPGRGIADLALDLLDGDKNGRPGGDARVIV